MRSELLSVGYAPSCSSCPPLHFGSACFTPAHLWVLMQLRLFPFRTIGDPATCPSGANLTTLTTPTIWRLCHPVRDQTPVCFPAMVSVSENCSNVRDRHSSFIRAENGPYLAPTGNVYFGPCECGGQVATCDSGVQGLDWDCLV